MDTYNALYDLDSLRLYKSLVEAQEIQLRLIERLAKSSELVGELDELQKAVRTARSQLNELIDPSQTRDI
ncbi:hypothetical protein [Ectopseudomonas hydrolytica]|uniref:hypothetical protein n=1 Tax=Ectopseudomonas hydrolytica TaxID=2493633 RepID=UPI001A24591C|nr:hypothetical protein [Pseudomonas aeruginosa]